MSNALNLKNESDKSDSFSNANSIDISLTPPLENLSITEGWNGELKAPYSIDEKEPYFKRKISESDDSIKTNELTDMDKKSTK